MVKQSIYFLLVSGLEGPSATVAASGDASKTQLLPTVMKNMQPSELINRYMDGIAKRINKLEDSWVAH